MERENELPKQEAEAKEATSDSTGGMTKNTLAEGVGLEPTSRFLHGYGLAIRWLTIRRTLPCLAQYQI